MWTLGSCNTEGASRWRSRRLFASVAVLLGACAGSPTPPSPEIVISNLKSNVLGSYLEVCGKGPGLTLTQFTLDFTVRGGIDVSADALVARIHSSASGDEDVVGQIAVCSSGPCAIIRRACITAGRSTTTGTDRSVRHGGLSRRVFVDPPGTPERSRGGQEQLTDHDRVLPATIAASARHPYPERNCRSRGAVRALTKRVDAKQFACDVV